MCCHTLFIVTISILYSVITLALISSYTCVWSLYCSVYIYLGPLGCCGSFCVLVYLLFLLSCMCLLSIGLVCRRCWMDFDIWSVGYASFFGCIIFTIFWPNRYVLVFWFVMVGQSLYVLWFFYCFFYLLSSKLMLCCRCCVASGVECVGATLQLFCTAVVLTVWAFYSTMFSSLTRSHTYIAACIVWVIEPSL